MSNNSGHYSLGPAQQDKKNLQEGPVHMLNPRITPLWSMGGIKTNQGCMEELHKQGDMEQRSMSWTPGCTKQSQKMSKILNTGTASRKHHSTSPQSQVCREAAQEKHKTHRKKNKPLTAMTRGQQDTASAQTNKKNLRCGNRKGLLGRNDQTHHEHTLPQAL